MSVHILMYSVCDIYIFQIQCEDLVCPKYRALLQKEGRTLPRFPHTPLLGTNNYERTILAKPRYIRTNNFKQKTMIMIEKLLCLTTGPGKALTVCFACQQKTMH